ncbi:hypothetical protein PAAG_11760 [Paracoccidioides lutzii Pb01]|uniref:Uncharacterized protein n=1 Tax=Paracoccidioides lutzii (strain ATCC MYA-826 / Pb01) TaxID=502779 RepID=A0A0A2V1Z6_PARBA|nr:hypothetical protein PAAG_11760 [Paracoccidioides lutzii Pb01]KGQ01523.1 hypothetical protein PAAG_11760 [Paracoccidioides lutzii Pb01]
MSKRSSYAPNNKKEENRSAKPPSQQVLNPSNAIPSPHQRQSTSTLSKMTGPNS